MIGVLNVLFEDNPAEVEQYYRSLHKAFAEEGPAYRVFTLDNSREPLRHLIPRDAAYRHFPENIGYTRACNLLMAEAFAAGCDKVLATNVDGFMLPGCLANLLAAFDRHRGRVLVEARQFPKEHRKDYDPQTGFTEWVTGCCLLIGRETVEKLGPLDEAMFIYGEDLDYSFRAKRAGIPSVICDDALFFHRYVASANSRAKLRHALTTSRYLAAKWSASEMQRRVEEELVSEGFFASGQDLPDLPVGMQTYPCPVAWIPSFKRTFGPRRWEV